jgi:O-glycosyl hydrolase
MMISHQVLALLGSVFGLARASLDARQAGTQLTVNLAQKYQIIDGFGFSEAFQRANDLQKLPEDARQKVLDLLFNTTTGAGFTIVRNGIGSSVDSRSDWMNTILPRNPGGPSSAPQYVWDGKDSGQLWFSKEAMKYGVKTFYANAWSAPGFMKTNNNDANGGTLCGVSGARCSSGDWRQAYADYLVQYIKYYQQEGVPISFLGFLNEPDLTYVSAFVFITIKLTESARTSYASMLSSGTQAADFVKILHPTLQKNNLSHIGITCCDSAGWNNQRSMLSQLKSSGVENQLARITSHGYTSAPSGTFSTPLPVWQTEWMDSSGSWTTPWYGSGGAGDGYTWAGRIHSGLTSCNVSAYFYWVGVQRNSAANSKLITVTSDGRGYQVSKRLWAYGQYSRFVRPGAVRVGISSGNNLRTSAFSNVDGSIAVVVINGGTGATNVQIGGTGAVGGMVTAWVTDNSRDMASLAASIDAAGVVTGSIPGRAMVTFVIRGQTTPA